MRPPTRPGEVERLTSARRPHLFQFARADRALRRARQGSRRQDRRAHQSRLLQRHARRRALRSVRAVLALRHDAGADRRAAVGRDRHLPRPRAMREPGGRLGRPHRARRARVRALHPPGEGGELRRRPLHQQAGLRRRQADRGDQGLPRRVRRRGHPRAGRRHRRRRGLSRRDRDRPALEREGHRHPRHLGELPHAGRARGAVHARRHRRVAAGRCTRTTTFSAARRA